MSEIRRRIAEFQIAIMLLTRLPAGQLKSHAPGLDHAIWAYPFVGPVVGGLVCLIYAIPLQLGASPSIAAWIAFSGLVLMTGGLHFDGLADFADGLGGGADKARRLEIMRDSRIGSYGVLALICTAGLWTASVSTMNENLNWSMWIFVVTASRFFMTAAAIFLPPARSEGLGQSASGATGFMLIPSTGLVIILLALCGLEGLAVFIAMGLVSFGVSTWATKRIGGQTGDVLGTVQLSSETVGWVVLALF